MGFFSDILSMAMSEVANAVIDGMNETAAAQEKQTKYLEELEERYKNFDYETLSQYVEDVERDVNEIKVIKKVLADRAQLVDSFRKLSPAEAFSGFDDESFLSYYENLRASRGNRFSDEDAKTLIAVFQKELKARPIAESIYAESKEDCFVNTRFDELEPIILSDDIYYDEVLKAEAERELDYRKNIIEVITSDEIEGLDNDEFMEIYALVRADKTEFTYDDIDKIFEGTVDYSKYTLFNTYFGKYREKMLKNCEKELIENRKYLLREFLGKYCEEEINKYYNYSEKKLKSILSFTEIKVNTESLSIDELEEYDLCDKFIANVILEERREK